MFFVTGDTHGRFERIEKFCAKMETAHDDVMIILGDAGINFMGGFRDYMKKERIRAIPITLFCIHGNHERRPETISTYREMEWKGGTVYVEDEFPSILFAKDGEVYNLNGMHAIAIGGAYSIDWMLRTPGQTWWLDEQPSPEIKARVEKKLEQLNWKVDIVLSHTAPLKYEPTEFFLPGVDQSKVDKSTEIWLDSIEERLVYRKWYCGHYHTKKNMDRLQIMFENCDSISLSTDIHL